MTWGELQQWCNDNDLAADSEITVSDEYGAFSGGVFYENSLEITTDSKGNTTLNMEV